MGDRLGRERGERLERGREIESERRGMNDRGRYRREREGEQGDVYGREEYRGREG